MCEAHAYLLRNGVEDKILESVDLVEFDGDQVKLVNIFGEQKILKARLSRYDGRQGKMLFQAV